MRFYRICVGFVPGKTSSRRRFPLLLHKAARLCYALNTGSVLPRTPPPQNVLCCLEAAPVPIRSGGCFICAGGSRGQYAQLLRRFCALCASVAGLLRCFRSKMSKSPPGFITKMSNSPLGVLNIFVRNLHPTRANPLKIEQVRTAYIFVHRQKALPAAKPFSKFPETAKQRA